MSGVGEIIGITASLVTLINVLSTAAKASIDVCQSVEDAPMEVAVFTTHLLIVQAELEQLKSCGPELYEEFSTQEARVTLKAAFDGAHSNLVALYKACTRLQCASNSSLPNRLRWAYLKRPAVEKLLRNIRYTESSLNAILNLLAFRGQSKFRSELDSLKQLMTVKVQEAPSKESTAVTEAPIQHMVTRIQATGDIRHAKSTFVQSLGVKASSVSTLGPLYTTYSFAIRFKIPFSMIFGARMFTANLGVRQFAYSKATLSLLPQSGLSAGALVPEDSLIMSACKLGDVKTVQLLLESHQARVDDVTPDNMTTMKFAIDSGNVELVKTLLDNGLQVNWTFGQYQTSALQWAIRQKQFEIVRLLLRYGACPAHISAWGWTPVFFLWPAPSKGTEPMTPYLRLLGTDASIEWESFDTWGWTVLDRAAAFGTGDEVAALIAYGAKPSTPALPLRWTALHHAVFYGNMETFLVLVAPEHGVCVDAPDARGWTLLHIAASAGHDAIVRYLLGRGADHEIRSVPFPTHMPEELCGKGFAPGRAAAAQSDERYGLWVQALADFGLEEALEEDSEKGKIIEEEEEEEGWDGGVVFADAQEKWCAGLE